MNFVEIHFSKFTSLGPFHDELGHIVLKGLGSHSLWLLYGILSIHNLHWDRLLWRLLGAALALLGALSLFLEGTARLRLQKTSKPSQVGLFDQVFEVGMLVLDVNVRQVLLSEGSATATALIRGSIFSVSCNLHDEGANLSLLYHNFIIIQILGVL